MNFAKCILFLGVTLSCGVATAAPQSTAFTYQGRLLQNGTPTNGAHNLAFTLWDAASGGAQVGSTITQAGFPVANGVFTIDLDFGPNMFNGQQRYLEVAVDGSTLAPRQPIGSAPAAQFAQVASSGGGTTLTGATTTQFSNDRLYAGVSVAPRSAPMVMLTAPAFNPAGATVQPGYAGGVDVYNLTSQVVNSLTLGGAGGGVGKASSGDVRVLAALDPAYKDLASRVYAGTHYDNLQIDVLQPSSGKPLQSYCYGTVYVTGVQPLAQAGLLEITLTIAKTGQRVARLDGSGAILGYVEGGFDFSAVLPLSNAPCVTPPP